MTALVTVLGLVLAFVSVVLAAWALPPGTIASRLLYPFRMFNPLVSPRQQQAAIQRIVGGAFFVVGVLIPVALLIYPLPVSTGWQWAIWIVALWILICYVLLLWLWADFVKTSGNLEPDRPGGFKLKARANQKTRRLWNWFSRR